MKTLLKVYLWSVYIVGAPLALILATGTIIWSIVDWYKDFHELLTFSDIKDSLLAMWNGALEGHRINMTNLDELCKEKGW